MHTLQMLGGISLTDEAGKEVDALLRQSKHVALLAYLASPKPGTWHKRDSVIGSFWAEHDQTRARSAFRSALYTLRGHLPDNAIRSRGDNDLSVDPQIIRTDTGTMSDLLEQGEYAQALALYKGEFLPGIYIPDAEGFDQWLEQERRRTRDLASEAARQLSKKLESEKDQSGAIRAAKHNYELDPDDEGTARRLIALLDHAGDRAQAFAVYEEFRNHIYEAFGVRPSAETVALLDAIRTRSEPLQKSVVTAIPPTDDRAERPAAAASHVAPSPPKQNRARVVALIAIPLAIGALAWTMWPNAKAASDATAASAATRARTMVVLPATNETGNPALDYLATGIAEDLARRLEDIGGFVIRSAARSSSPQKIRDDLRGVSRAYNAGLILRTSLKMAGDSIQMSASVVDAANLEEEPITTQSFSQSSIADVESRIAAAVAGGVFRKPLPQRQATAVDPESYRLSLQAFHQFLTPRVVRNQGPLLNAPSAMELFSRAVQIDANNARAYSGISSVLSSRLLSDQTSFDVGFDKASAAATTAIALDSLQGTAYANLGLLRALKFRRVSAGLPLIEKAEAAEPSNAEVYLVKSALYRHSHQWDKARDAIRVAQKLAPMSSLYFDREALIEFCMGRPANALAVYRAEFALDPADGVFAAGITRSLAMLGRFDEALDSWRSDAKLQRDTTLVRLLANAHGQSGYWNTRHIVGRMRLDSLTKRTGRASRVQIMRAYFAAGDSASGFAEAEKVVNQGLSAMYRLPCIADVDEYRNTPRFKALVARAGFLPQ